jgi:hypothetical protein
MVVASMSFDWNDSLCWMDRYHAALKRRRGLTWRRRFNRTTLTVGMLLAGALLLALLVPA